MRKITFSIGGRRFEVELDDDFAKYVLDKLAENHIAHDRDNSAMKFLSAYLRALKDNFNNKK